MVSLFVHILGSRSDLIPLRFRGMSVNKRVNFWQINLRHWRSESVHVYIGINLSPHAVLLELHGGVRLHISNETRSLNLPVFPFPWLYLSLKENPPNRLSPSFVRSPRQDLRPGESPAKTCKLGLSFKLGLGYVNQIIRPCTLELGCDSGQRQLSSFW